MHGISKTPRVDHSQTRLATPYSPAALHVGRHAAINNPSKPAPVCAVRLYNGTCQPSINRRIHLIARSTNGQQQQQESLGGTTNPWGYPGSHVRPLPLEYVKLIHQTSFGHRNLRTYLLVVTDPSTAPVDLGFEAEIERLAAGLSHARHVVVGQLQAGQWGPSGRMFVERVLGVVDYPALLMYPEAAPGYLRHRAPGVTAESLLQAINRCYSRVLPYRKALELNTQNAATATAAADNDAGATAADMGGKRTKGGKKQGDASRGSRGGKEGGGKGQSAQQQGPQPSSSSSASNPARHGAEAGAEAGAAASTSAPPTPATATANGGEGGSSSRSSAPSTSAHRQQQQQQAAKALPASRTAAGSSGSSGYWTRGKVTFWVCVAALSVVGVMWDRWLEPWLEARALKRRLQARAAGTASIAAGAVDAPPGASMHAGDEGELGVEAEADAVLAALRLQGREQEEAFDRLRAAMAAKVATREGGFSPVGPPTANPAAATAAAVAAPIDVDWHAVAGPVADADAAATSAAAPGGADAAGSAAASGIVSPLQ